MQDIQIVISYNINDFGGKCSIIGWILKERIIVAVHFMIKHIGFEVSQPYRSPVCDEMYLVTPAGETEAQLGGYYSGAAVSGVTNDTYFHAFNYANYKQHKWC
jgi:hypothetical protein